MGIELAAGAVAAAGNAAGGLAASAIMGKGKGGSKGGGIPGLTTSKPSAKGMNDTATQIDPTTAINYFQKAAGDINDYYTKGFDLYSKSLSSAVTTVTDSYKNANDLLTPLANEGRKAQNKYMQMLGLDGTSDTAQFVSDAEKTIGGSFSELYKQMYEAEKLQDPTARLATKNQLLGEFSSQIQKSNADVTTQQAALKALGVSPKLLTPVQVNYISSGMKGTITDYATGQVITKSQMAEASAAAKDPNSPYYTGGDTKYIWPTSPGNFANYNYNDYGGTTQGLYEEKTTRAQQAIDKYTSQSIDLSNKISTDQANIKALTDAQKTYDMKYTGQSGNFAYNGNQVAAQLQQTPGYQFNLNQGTQAISRTNQASGILNSGNTAAGLIRYGQDYANNAYQTYLGNLQTTAVQGGAATAQISQNQLSKGDALSQLTQLGGMAAMQTQQAIGQAYANANNNSASVWNQDMLANMQAQNNAILQARSQSAQAQNASLAAGVSMANTASNNNVQMSQLGLQQAQFNYGVMQNQNFGRGFNTNQSNSGFMAYGAQQPNYAQYYNY